VKNGARICIIKRNGLKPGAILMVWEYLCFNLELEHKEFEEYSEKWSIKNGLEKKGRKWGKKLTNGKMHWW
jgi:hypothetical protein